MMRKRNISIVLLILFMVAACAGFTKNTYRGLVVSNQTYDGTFKALADLKKEGKLSQENWDKAAELGRTYKKAHNMAVDVLATYEEAGGQGDKAAVTAAVEKASIALADLIAYARPFLEGGS